MFNKILKHWYLMRDNDAASDAAIIQASAQVASSAINYAASGDTNKRTLKYNREMYDKQRKDALIDRDYANSYNSPSSVMERYKAAGLNPNLIYGNGTNAESAPVRASSAPSWNPQAPRVDLDASSAIAAYNDTRMKTAQVNQLKSALEQQELQKMLTAAQTGKTIADTDLTKLTTDQKKMMQDMYAEAMRLGNQKTAQEIDIARQQNERSAEMQGEQILNMIQQRSMNNLSMDEKNHLIELLKKDERIKELDAKMADQGIRPSDSAVWKIIQDLLNKMGGEKGSWMDKFKNYLEWNKTWDKRKWGW